MNSASGLSTKFLGIFSHSFEMPINFSPPAIIFINKDLTAQVQSVFVRQLYLNEVMDGYTFDTRVAADATYPTQVHQDGYRIMVMRDLWDNTNRPLADIVLFAKSGLVSVESNKYGPPNITLPIDRVYLTALINLQSNQPSPENPADLDDGFVGETDNDDFNPTHMDPPTNIEPV